jgi:hypothetical protein
MSFIEVESWEIAEGNEEAHHESIRRWFAYVEQRYPEMFAEWKSTRYFRQVDTAGNPTGRYIMMFEFYTLEGRDAYKIRRRTLDSYAAYRADDPYHLFKEGSIRTEYWEPQEQGLWFEHQ